MKATFVMRPDGNLYRGGAELMIERTKSELESLGWEVEILTPLTRTLGDVLHFFGCYDSHLSVAKIALDQSKPYVVFPLYSTGQTPTRLKRRATRHRITNKFPKAQEELLRRANRVIVQTNREADRLAAYFGLKREGIQVIPHGVDERFAHASPEEFREWSSLREPFVISTGAIMALKNQLNLVRALRDTGIPAVIAGNPLEADYLKQCKAEASPNIHFLDPIPYESSLLASAYAAAGAFALVSYNETFCMAAMEAAVAGCPLVLSDRWQAEEIYGETAIYINPDDLLGIRAAVIKALGKGKQPQQAQSFLKKYSWAAATKQLEAVYCSLLKG